MNFDPSRYVRIEPESPWTEARAHLVLDQAKAQAEARGVWLVFIDIRKVPFPDCEMTRYYSGTYLAQLFRPPYKVAACSLPEAINHFAESAAVNRGALFRVFSDETDALEWLLG